MRYETRKARRLTVAGVVAAFMFWVAGVMAAEWAVPDATIRFDVGIIARPSEPAAGIIAILPDGGILPRPAPGCVVLDGSGKELRSQCLWQNPGQGVAIAFENPAANHVSIYVKPVPSIAPAPADLKLYPSLLLYTRVVADSSLEAAEQMAMEFPPGKNALMGPVAIIGHTENVFGSDDSYISYYSGWMKVNSKDAGKTWIATISDKGSVCRIDGKVAAEWPGMHTRWPGSKGQFGTYVDLSAGLHRVEYFHFSRPETAGPHASEAHLVWRLPGVPGGALPVTIMDTAYVHSGAVKIQQIVTKSGVPPAVFEAHCHLYLWVKDKPLYLFRFETPFSDQYPQGTTYLWRMDDGREVHEKEFSWLVEGEGPRPVTLTVSAAGGASSCSRLADEGTRPAGASLEDTYECLQFRNGFLAMCRATPAGKLPCADWTPDMWATLLAVMEPYKGRPLLEEIFERSRPDVMALAADDRRTLEDLFFEAIRYSSKTKAVTWLDTLEQDEKDRSQKLYWQLARIDFYLYDMNDSAHAGALAEALQAAATTPEETAHALIFRGDIARLAGDTDKATELYGQAQDLPGKPQAMPLVSAAEVETRTRANRGAHATNTTSRADAERASRPHRADNWRAETVRGSVYYTTVHDLLEKGYILDARKALRQWEMDVPLSKVNGDYPVGEAEYYSAIHKYSRALRVLQAYRKGVDMSAFLPEAMTLEIDCLLNLDRDAEAKELADAMVKRLPGHPAAKHAQDLLKIVQERKAKPSLMKEEEEEE